jgi:hypothetical protein
MGMIVWMERRAHGLTAGIEADGDQAMSASGYSGLFAPTFVAGIRDDLKPAIFTDRVCFSRRRSLEPTLSNAGEYTLDRPSL